MRLSLIFRLLLTGCLIVPGAATQGQQRSAGPSSSRPTRSNLPPIDTQTTGDSQFVRDDLIKLLIDAQNSPQAHRMVENGTVSVLDLKAPAEAVKEFGHAADSIRRHHPSDAQKHLVKAIVLYPEFVSAHNNLGVVYFSLEQKEKADAEFQTAARLDPKFPGSYVNLGNLAYARQDYTSAEINLQKAADLLPRDVKVLTLLTFSENGNRHYAKAIDTAVRVHSMEHKQFADAHYVAAAAAISLKDYLTAQSQLTLFLREDPHNKLATAARHSLDELAHQPAVRSATQEAVVPKNQQK